MKSTLQIAVESELKSFLGREPNTMDFIMCSLVPRNQTQSNLYYQKGWDKLFINTINH